MNGCRRDPLDRRTFLRALTATGAAALLAACDGTTPPAGTATAPAPASSAPIATPVSAGLAKARQDGLKLGFSGGAPFSILQPDGTSFTGAGPELARAVLGELGVTRFEGVKIDFAGLIPALQAGRIDIIVSATNITPERCQQVVFADPFIVTLNSFATIKGGGRSFRTFEEVAKAGARLGVVQGAVDVKQAQAAGVAADRLVQFPDVTNLLSGLRDGRVDAAVAAIVSLRYTSEQTGQSDRFDYSEPFTPVLDGKPQIAAAGMVFRQEDRDFAAAYTRAQAGLMASGEALRLMAPFGTTKESVDEATKLTAARLCAGS